MATISFSTNNEHLLRDLEEEIKRPRYRGNKSAMIEHLLIQGLRYEHGAFIQ